MATDSLPHSGLGPVVTWAAACPPIDPGRILRLHNYTDRAKVRAVIARTAAHAAKRAQELAEPCGCWRRVTIESLGDGRVRLAGGGLITCAAFDELLSGAVEAVVFVMALGEAIDRVVSELYGALQEPVEALFLETAGRLAIEKLTRVLVAEIGRSLGAEKLILGPRLGPGYSYKRPGADDGTRVMWPLEQQRELFALFAGHPLPVELMESAAMRPKMSRSGLIGLHRAEGDDDCATSI